MINVKIVLGKVVVIKNFCFYLGDFCIFEVVDIFGF